MIWIGDVHGCAKTLRALLTKLPNKEIGFLGDLVDRGPNSLEAIRVALDTADTILCGNHEQMLIMSTLKNNLEINPSNDFVAIWSHPDNGGGWAITGKDIELIEKLYHRLEIFKVTDASVAVHGCADKEIWNRGWSRPFTAYEMLALGMTTPNPIVEKANPEKEEIIGNLLSGSIKENLFQTSYAESPYSNMLWGRNFNESIELSKALNRKVIHGHTQTRNGKVVEHDGIIFVDTGCYNGNNNFLSAYDDETGETWQQQNIEI